MTVATDLRVVSQEWLDDLDRLLGTLRSTLQCVAKEQTEALTRDLLFGCDADIQEFASRPSNVGFDEYLEGLPL